MFDLDGLHVVVSRFDLNRLHGVVIDWLGGEQDGVLFARELGGGACPL